MEPWWIWHWDVIIEKDNPSLLCASITRWRRGSFLTIYRVVLKDGGVWWWLYGPFNLAIGFGHG